MSNYFSSVADALLNGMGTNLFAKSANLISGIAPLFAAGFGIYILLVLISYYNRGLDENIVDFSKRMIGWFIIIACAFNAGMYNKLANLMYQMPDGISSFLGTGEYTFSALDTSFENLEATVVNTLDYASDIPMTSVGEKIGAYIFALVIFVLGSLFFAITAAFYLVAKLSMAMVIMVGPIFLGAMLFPATRQWGMNWIGQILNYTITIVFYVILGSLQQEFFKNHVSTIMNGEIHSLIMLLPMACLMAISTFIFLIVAWNVPSIASALTGGAGVGGMPRTLVSAARYMRMPSMGGTGGGGAIKRG